MSGLTNNQHAASRHPPNHSLILNKLAFLTGKVNLGGAFPGGRGKGGQDQMLFTVGETLRSGSDEQTPWEWGGMCAFENTKFGIDMEEE